MNNKILKIAKIAARYLLGMDILLGAILILFMIARPLELSFLENIRLIPESSIFRFEISPSAEGVPLSDYNGFHFYLVCIKALVVVSILFRIIQVSIRVINSISSLKTFQVGNIKSFRLMGKLFLAWFAVDIISLEPALSGNVLRFELNFVYAICALICFVLAEIFSEGNKLMEENKLTI